MLERLVRRIFEAIGIQQMTDEDVIRVIRTLKLDKLPAHLVFALITIMPVITLVLKRIQMETIDWSELTD
jgi:hypothetical protein